jgi:hypothetical protein
MENESMKEFNDTGLCVPHLHYMADRTVKLKELVKLSEKGKYFTINRPRQYGKTTFLYLLEKELEKKGYMVIKLSFEGIGDRIFSNEEFFVPGFLRMVRGTVKRTHKETAGFILEREKPSKSLQDLSEVITDLVDRTGKKIVLAIDDVDKSSNNQLFLSFLGMLRAKYLARNAGDDSTFHAVILAGVHDVKTLKQKIRQDEEQKYNSPWNIAVDLKLDFNLDLEEIESLLRDFLTQHPIRVNTRETAQKLHHLTSGHPFLVSRLCKIIAEDIRPAEEWTLKDIDTALNILVEEDNTNFKTLIKNLENNGKLYDLVFRIVMDGEDVEFNSDNPVIELGGLYGFFKDQSGRLRVHNRIYEQRIYNYMTSKIRTSVSMGGYNFSGHFIETNGTLNLQKVLLKFQAFLKEQYSQKDRDFLERNGRLLFLAFLKPIINGKGHDFKEVEISEVRRLDIAVTFLEHKYIVELKKWYGQNAHQRGLRQLVDYLERQNLDSGYLVVFDTGRKSKKTGKSETVTVDSKQIFTVYV